MRVAVLLALAVGVALQAAPPEVFDVGVLRRDGIIVPFATFDGHRWSAHWPAPEDEATVPINLESVPSKWWGDGAHDVWTAALRSGAERRLRVTQPDVFDAHCYRQVGLRTDYVPDAVPPPPSEQPYPKDGLVFAPAHPVDRIDILPSNGREAAALASVLLAEFNRAEAKTVNGLDHPVKEADRNAMTPTVEALYAYGTEPRVYYVEASRSYEAMGLHDCIVAFGTGWFVGEHGTFRPVSMAVDELDCERQGASFMLPLGVVRSGSRLFWIVQFSGWDHERFVVIEPKLKSVDAVLNVWEGGC